jgi:hypothetical protein
MAVNRPGEPGAQEAPPPEIAQPEAHHEQTDINSWAVGKFGIALLLASIAVLFVVVGVFRYFERRENAAQAPPPAGLNEDARALPPEPRLQTAPTLDLEEMRAAEDQILNGYGWVDASKGIVRIPIARAIDLVVQQGLAGRPQTMPETASSAVVPTESGLGPIMIRPGGPLGQ